MTKDEILHLGHLSRIALTPDEITTFSTEIDTVLDYVSTVKDIMADAPFQPTPGPRYNVFRTDEVTNKLGEYTDRLLTAMPSRDGQYMSVKKILTPGK